MLDERIERVLRKPSCSVPEAAEMLSLSRSGVYDAIERGDLQAILFAAAQAEYGPVSAAFNAARRGHHVPSGT